MVPFEMKAVKVSWIRVSCVLGCNVTCNIGKIAPLRSNFSNVGLLRHLIRRPSQSQVTYHQNSNFQRPLSKLEHLKSSVDQEFDDIEGLLI